MLDKIAISIFTLYGRIKGYQVQRIRTAKEINERANILEEVHQNELNWHFPKECMDWMEKNYTNAISFIVYHKKIPVGTISLFDPKYANRLYEGYGINEDGCCYELGALAVKRDYRFAHMITFILLFKAVYLYSKKNSISCWLAISSKALFEKIKSFDSAIAPVYACTSNGVTKSGINYHEVCEKVNPGLICYRMSVSSYSPYRIIRKFFVQILKK